MGIKDNVHVLSKQKDGKFGQRLEEGIFVRYGNSKSYRVLLKRTKKIVISQNVTFDEPDALFPRLFNNDCPFIEFEQKNLEPEYMGSDLEQQPASNPSEPGAEESLEQSEDQKALERISEIHVNVHENSEVNVLGQREEEQSKSSDLDDFTYDPSLNRSMKHTAGTPL